MVKCIQKICSQAASPQTRLGTIERTIQGLQSMVEAEKKILGHSSRLLGSDLHLEGVLCAEHHRAE